MTAGVAGNRADGGPSPAGRARGGPSPAEPGRRLAPHIELILRAREFCEKPAEDTKAALVARVEDCAAAEIPELYNPLFAACLAVRGSRPVEWRALVEKIDEEIHAIGNALRAGGWFNRKDIAA